MTTIPRAEPRATGAGGWARRLRDLTGWRVYAVVALFGAAGAFALPPWHLVPLLIPAFTGLLWTLSARRPGAAFFLGWAFGTGHFLVAMHWIAHPLLVDPARHGWLIPFAVGGLAAAMGLYVAATTWLLAVLERRREFSIVARVFAFAGIWLFFEWVRRWAFTGFPWDLLGYVWAFSPPMSQAAALGGIWSLTLLTLIAAAAPVVLSGHRHVSFAALAVVIPALMWAGGTARLATAPPVGADLIADVRLRIVQANIPQRLKWHPDHRVRNLQKQVAMSATATDTAAPNVVIWPETAAPFFLATDEDARTLAALAVPDDGLLLTGAPRASQTADLQQFWNSVHAIDAEGAIVSTYDKAHLVPFGEYVPARGILPLDKIVAGAGDFSPGPGRMTLSANGLPPFAPLVCYEVIFPGAVTAAERPDWLLNVTNDAWFGPAAGPAQHFAIARMRTVEEGLPLVRAANTGISAVVDSYGRVVARLDSGVEGILDAGLPMPQPPTLFARLGDWTLLILLAITGSIAFLGRRAH